MSHSSQTCYTMKDITINIRGTGKFGNYTICSRGNCKQSLLLLYKIVPTLYPDYPDLIQIKIKYAQKDNINSTLQGGGTLCPLFGLQVEDIGENHILNSNLLIFYASYLSTGWLVTR